MAAGGPGAGRVATPARPARARAHAVGLGHLLHERARAVLHTTRLGVAPAGKGIEVGDLTRPTVPTPCPTVLAPLQFRAAPRGVQRSSRLHHLSLQLLAEVGVRPQDWGRRPRGRRGAAGAAAPGLEGSRT